MLVLCQFGVGSSFFLNFLLGFSIFCRDFMLEYSAQLYARANFSQCFNTKLSHKSKPYTLSKAYRVQHSNFLLHVVEGCG